MQAAYLDHSSVDVQTPETGDEGTEINQMHKELVTHYDSNKKIAHSKRSKFNNFYVYSSVDDIQHDQDHVPEAGEYPPSIVHVENQFQTPQKREFVDFVRFIVEYMLKGGMLLRTLLGFRSYVVFLHSAVELRHSNGIFLSVCYHEGGLLIAASLSLQWSSIGRTLERHPFSGLVHSAGELLHTP